MVSKGYKVPTLDLGGGIGINYENNQTPDFSSYKKILLDVFAGTNYKLNFEPGRSLIAEAGILVTKVIRNKKTQDKNFIIVDAAMNNLIRPTLYEAYHKVEPILKKNNSVIVTDIVGPICETGDYIALDREIEKVESSELLAIRTTGAYSSVMRSNYNTRADAKEIFIYNKRDFLIREPETVKELISKEKVVNYN